MLPVGPPFYAALAANGGTGSITLAKALKPLADLKSVVSLDDPNNPADKVIPYLIISGGRMEWGASATVTVAGQFSNRTPDGTIIDNVANITDPQPLDLQKDDRIYWYDVSNQFDFAAAVASAQSNAAIVAAVRATVENNAAIVASLAIQAQADADAAELAKTNAQSDATIANAERVAMQAANAGVLNSYFGKDLAFTANLAADPDFIAGFVYDARNDPDGGQTWAGFGYPHISHVAIYKYKIEFRSMLDGAFPVYLDFVGDAPGLAHGPYVYAGGARTVSCGALLSGKLVVGTLNDSGAGVGMILIDIVAGEAFNYNLSNITRHSQPFSGRNLSETGKGYATTISSGGGSVGVDINFAAMTTLPNAPADENGRLVPTIVLATNAGVSLIDVPGVSGVVNITGLNASHVSIHNDKLYIVESGTSTVHVGPVAVAADIAVTTWRDKVYYGGSTPPLLNSAVTAIAGSIVGSSLGLTIIDEPSNAVRYISKEFATPPMTANTVAALMMDTATGVITGGELVANGVNPTDTAGWTVQNGTLEAIGGNFRLTTNGGIASAAFAMATVAGRSYQIELEFVADGLTGNAFLYAGTTAGGAQLANKVVASTLGIHRVVFVATGTTTYLSFACSSTTLANEAADFNNVHCYRVIQDRSGNGNHAQVFGSLPRTLAAAGGDLVEHGPFPAGVGYEIAFDTALDLSGDFLIAGLWRIGASGYDVGLEFAAPDYSGNDFTLETGGNQDVSFKSNSSTILTAASGLTTDTIVHFAAVRVSGVLTLYKNGYAVASVANTTDFSNPNAVLRFGGKVDGSVTADVSYLSRWIFEEGGLSADEVLSLAQSELAKAQAGQKITIQGTSNQVNDVAAWKGFFAAATDDGADVFDVKTGLWVKRYDTTNTALTDNQIKTLTASADGALVLSDSTKAQRIDKPEILMAEREWI